MAIALEGILGVLLLQSLPLGAQVWMQTVFASGLGNRLASLPLMNDLLLVLFGKDASFKAHSR